jgi:hypothetical protein
MRKLAILLLILICYRTSYSQNKPEVFILSVGVSKYQNPKFNLRYAHKDAIDLAEAFKKQTSLFDIREVIVLTDEKATRSSIRSELTKLKNYITANDLFIFVFSGHGLNESLVTYDFSLEDRTATSLQKSDLVSLIGQFNCNYIVLLDACHSGSFAKGIDISGGKDINADFILEQNIANEKLMRALNASDKANIVIGSSSSSEKSEECLSCQNGYFTQSILDAFEGKTVTDNKTNKTYGPDPDKNGFIYTDELDNYLKEAVSLNTRGNAINQSVISKQSPGFNFPLSKLKDSDGDGTADLYDECQGTKGTALGCPDADSDRVADKNDICPDQKGTKEMQGCPDKTSKQQTLKQAYIQKPPSKSEALSKSILFPGWGDKVLEPKKKKSWMGGAAYGSLSIGVLMNAFSKKSYKTYLESKVASEAEKLHSKTSLYSNLSKLFFISAGSIWAIDIGKVAFAKTDVLKVSPSKVSLKYNF